MLLKQYISLLLPPSGCKYGGSNSSKTLVTTTKVDGAITR